MRVRARVEGTVQGVGFRPYVYRLASELGCSGHVLNDARGVVVEVEADTKSVERFLARLPAEAPPLARIERVAAEPVPVTGETGFAIRASPSGGEPSAAVTADTATCAECLEELFDPADRRHRYPFVNCTNCGPRFTIVRGVPYDRPLTTMAGFAMCPACAAEYEDPLDRRFHAQPNACPECGPRARLVGADAEDAVAAAASALRDGAILAIKGVGGYHLACRADDEAAVAVLRARKHREDKPFALMAPTVVAARALVALGPVEEDLLVSGARPIVLARRRPDAAVAAAVAPGAPELGVMLPYSPLHHLLLADVGAPLVLTSGNVSDEPIAYTDDDALARLAPIADGFLVHDRPIQTRTDDSVVRVVDERPLVLRRSRGYVPDSLGLPVAAARHVLACGAELKSTFCVAKGARAWVGHHIGDLQNYETLRSFVTGVAHFEALVRGGARGRGPRPAPRVPVDEGRARALGCRSRGRAAPPRAPGRVPGRARGDRACAGGDLRRDRIRDRRDGVGRRAAARRPGRVRPRGVAVRGAHARRRGGDPPALAHGLCVDAGGRGGRRRRRSSRGRAGTRSPRWPAPAWPRR